MCSIGEVYKSALPSALILESETILTAEKEHLNSKEVTDERVLGIRSVTTSIFNYNCRSCQNFKW